MPLNYGDNLTVVDIDETRIQLAADDGSTYTIDIEQPPLPTPMLPVVPNDLTCPSCGNDRMLYVEDISCAREVEEFDGDTLSVNGLYTTDGFDDGTNPRIQCSSCCREFAVPDTVSFD